MGTNFYARIIPTEEMKETLKRAIDNNSYGEIIHLVDTFYGDVHNECGCGYVGGNVHLGKRSMGWKFLWNPNVYEIPQGHNDEDGQWRWDPSKSYCYYDLTREGLKKFIDREDVEIYDEYHRLWDKEEFWKMALEWGQEDGWDGDTYEEYEMKKGTARIHILRGESSYVRFLESIGYKMNKCCTDFYSDGLRFATTTAFS